MQERMKEQKKSSRKTNVSSQEEGELMARAPCFNYDVKCMCMNGSIFSLSVKAGMNKCLQYFFFLFLYINVKRVFVKEYHFIFCQALIRNTVPSKSFFFFK